MSHDKRKPARAKMRQLKPPRPAFWALLPLILLAALLSCGPRRAPREYITVGALIPLTGEYCDDGVRALNGLLLAKEDINENGGVLGKNIDIFVLDDKGDERHVVEQYRVLKEMGVSAIVGSIYSDVTLALAKAAEKDGIPVISPTASNPEVTSGRENVFRVIFIDDRQAAAAASFARETLGAKNALIVAGDGRYERLTELFEKEFKSGGGRIVARENIAGSDSPEAVMRKYRANQPDIVYYPTDYIRAAKFIEAAHGAGLDKTVFIGSDAWDGVLTFLHETSAAERVYYTAPFAFDDNSTAVTQFSQKYFDNFSFMPISTSALSYSAVQILVAAIEKAGNTNAKDIIREIRANTFDIVTGQIGYDEGNNPKPLNNAVYILRIRNGYYCSAGKAGV